MKYLFCILLFFLSVGNSSANELEIDSLTKTLPKLSPSEKVDALIRLSWLNRNINPDKMVSYGNEALSIQQKIDSLSPKMATIVNYIGVGYRNLGNYPKALDMYFATIDIAQKTKNEQQLGFAYQGIGDIFERLGEFDKAIEYCEKSITQFTKLDDDFGLGYAYHSLGRIYESSSDLKKSRESYVKVYQIRKSLGDTVGMSSAINRLGNIYREEGKYQEAIEHATESITLSRKVSDQIGIYYASVSLSHTYLLLKQPTKAIYHIKEAEKIAQILRNKEYLKTVSDLYSQYYDMVGNYQMALSEYKKYQAYQDSLYNEQNLKSIAQLELARKEAENNALLKERRLNDAILQKQKATLRYQNMIFIVVAVFLVSMGVVIAIQYRQKKREKAINEELKNKSLEIEKQSLKLKEINRLKDKLFSILAHDLRSPLTGLKGTLDLIQDDALSKEELQSIIKNLKDNFQYVNSTLENLLRWSVLQFKGDQIIRLEAIDLKCILEESVGLMKQYAFTKEIKINMSIQPENLQIMGDSDQLRVVFRNLLNNAIKFSNKGQTVNIQATVEGHEAVIEVTDYGVGVPIEKIDTLFEVNDYTSTPGTLGEKGTGLGLILCKEFIENNKGSIAVKTELNKGTTFSVRLIKV